MVFTLSYNYINFGKYLLTCDKLYVEKQNNQGIKVRAKPGNCTLSRKTFLRLLAKVYSNSSALLP